MTFTINGYDFSHDIVMGTYSANMKDVYDSWTDANGVNHRVVIRRKAHVTANLYLRNNQRVEAFRNMVNSQLRGGFYIASVQMNDSNEVHTGNFYLDYEAIRDTIGVRDGLKEFTISLEER